MLCYNYKLVHLPLCSTGNKELVHTHCLRLNTLHFMAGLIPVIELSKHI